MAKLIVHNSCPLSGIVDISGAKNAVLPLMAAALLQEGTCVIDDVPVLQDVKVMESILSSLGADVSEREPHILEISVPGKLADVAARELVEKMRASFLIMGPLLARRGNAKVYLPGGCTIGARPIDLHLKGFRALGAEVILNEFSVEASAPAGGLVGASVYLDFPSVGATENIMMAATLAKGTTTIENAAEEPEIVDLANFLNKMGARVKGAGTDTVKIEGVESLHATSHSVIPDRIETGTYMLAAAITRGEVLVRNIVPDHIKPITAKLRECGVIVELTDDGMYVSARGRKLRTTDIKTFPYPGFPTDIQSPFTAFLSTVEGTATVIETVFEERFMYAEELKKMGADITVKGDRAVIRGVEKLEGTGIAATDLRGGAAAVLAALAAEGTTEISEIHHIERGYENLVEKLRGIGADISKTED